MAALEAGDFRAAYALLLPHAEAGDAAAQYEVGLMLDSGRGTAPDAGAAAQWFLAAAEQNHALAQ
ncbi:MAG: sel1 repeat family protein, partial [Pseudomonadota bacterium]|nr:sel1 repeat family protein [Pseudomonadota bacterium]